jgi:hypothetical protein
MPRPAWAIGRPRECEIGKDQRGSLVEAARALALENSAKVKKV